MLTVDQIKAFREIEKHAKTAQKYNRDNYGELLTATELRHYIAAHKKAPLMNSELLEYIANIVEFEIGIRI